jgi:DNA-binding transcriptional regulator GbsR (MarR family)
LQPDALSRSKALFIRRWGEMGGYWGINRTMAELHALLYISAEPLNTDQIMDALAISRGNTSMNIRQLVDWGLVSRVHHKGDRKEYFAAETNVWEMFQTIVRERRRREVEPIVETINRCREMIAEQPSQGDADCNGKDPRSSEERKREARVYRQRLDAMHDFLSALMMVLNSILKSGQGGLAAMTRMTTKPDRPARSGAASR